MLFILKSLSMIGYERGKKGEIVTSTNGSYP